MAYMYKHFIPQNIAPKGAKRIVVHDSTGKLVCSMPLGALTPPEGKPLYSVGIGSDLHVYPHAAVAWTPESKLDNALTICENAGCVFFAHSGDISQTGLFRESDPDSVDVGQFAAYKEVRDKHAIPVYGICGNHESYMNPITNNLAELKTYTGTDLYYKVEHQNDVFIFCGQPAATTPMSDEAFTFLSETLSTNSGKRCFVFVHPVWDDDSGDAAGVYVNHSGLGGPLLSSWSKGAALKNLLKQYPKVVLFHGHTHIKFQEQEKDKSLNYTHKNGFHSIHIPSLSRPRDIVNNALVYAESESQGYIVDVYEDFVVLRGWDFVGNKPVPLGTYKIPT